MNAPLVAHLPHKNSLTSCLKLASTGKQVYYQMQKNKLSMLANENEDAHRTELIPNSGKFQSNCILWALYTLNTYLKETS